MSYKEFKVLLILVLSLNVACYKAYSYSDMPDVTKEDSLAINSHYQEAAKLFGSDNKRADSLINIAWKKAIHIGYQQGVADGYYYIGRLFELRADFVQAIGYYEKAKEIYQQAASYAGLVACYNQLGQLYLRQNQFFRANQNFVAGIRIADAQNNLTEKVKLMLLWANYKNKIGDHNGAIQVLDSIAMLAVEQPYSRNLGNIFLVYSHSYNRIGNTEQALLNSQKAILHFTEAGDELGVLMGMLAEGDVYVQLRDEERLSQLLNEVRPYLAAIGDTVSKAAYELLETNALYLRGEYHEAQEKAAELYKKYRDGAVSKGDLREVMALLIKTKYATKDFDDADHLFHAYQQLSDSLYMERYGDTEESAVRDAVVAKQAEVKALGWSNTIYQRYGLILGIVILLAVLVILYVLFRDKDKLANRVAIKNAEISVQNEILRQANIQNELLLREIHHRVKNNLQIINSLLSLQARKTAHPEVIEIMKESRSRLNSIALIHNKLYQQQSLGKLNIQEYITQLGIHLQSIYNVHNNIVDIRVEAEGVSLDIDTAIPLGLILTELITNSLKYAFTNRENGEIHIAVKHAIKKDYELIYSDNGDGIPESIMDRTNETLGLKLIDSLTRQLAGIVNYTSKDYSRYNIQFKAQL